LNEKYQCEICQKGFCGEEFVWKHIRNKHADILNDKICKHFFKEATRDAYFKDDNRLENPPIGYSHNLNQTGQQRNRPSVPKRREDGEPDLPPPPKEYVDYDDPLATGLREAQKNQQLITAGGVGRLNKQNISYDDLF
jgi:hypothetical protein